MSDCKGQFLILWHFCPLVGDAFFRQSILHVTVVFGLVCFIRRGSFLPSIFIVCFTDSLISFAYCRLCEDCVKCNEMSLLYRFFSYILKFNNDF